MTALRFLLIHLGMVVFAFLAGLFAMGTGTSEGLQLLKELESAIYRSRMAASGALHAPDPRIVIAGIDEESFQKAYHRAKHARILRNLRAAGVEVVFVDLLFEEPRDPVADRGLVAALEDTDFAVIAQAAVLEEVEGEDGVLHRLLLPGALMEPLSLGVLDTRIRTGLINTDQESGMVLRAILAMDLLDPEGGLSTLPSAALAVLTRANNLLPSDLVVDGTTILAAPMAIPCEVNSEVGSIEGEEVEVARFYKQWIRYHPPATGLSGQPGRPGRFPVVPYHRLLDPHDPIFQQMDGRIVLIGENTHSDTDLYQTPVGPMKGVEIHANILDMLLSNRILRRAPDWWNELHAFALGLAIAFTVAVLGKLRNGVLGALALLAADFGANLGLFMTGWYFSASLPLVVGGVTLLLCLTFRYFHALGVLEKYLPREAVDALVRSGRAGAREQVATVMVTDIRGYTTLSEGKTPLEILRMLNEYHDATVQVYEHFGGNALTYQGDAQIVVFPQRKGKDMPGRAILAALEMQQTVDLLRTHWGIQDRSMFDVGAALVTGR
ncbi:MAG: adenylate/guanylate cyclase domain-containing protein, partial [Candidatus Eremiobacterota bacterium]